LAASGAQSQLGVARGLIPVPVEFLSEVHVAAYGRFDGVPARTTRAENPDGLVLRDIHGHYRNRPRSWLASTATRPGRIPSTP
jgi:hypothetical protein